MPSLLALSSKPSFLIMQRISPQTPLCSTFFRVHALTSNDIKVGTNIEVDGAPWRVLEFLHVKPGKGAAFVRTKICNYVTGTLLKKLFELEAEQLRILFLEESSIHEKNGDWLYETAMNNSVLEVLNFYMTDLNKVKFEDLELIAKNCRLLVSVKITDCEILNLLSFFQKATTALEEFCGDSFNDSLEKYFSMTFPQKLCRLGLTYMGKNETPIMFPFASLLKKVDLLYALLDTEDHYHLIQKCPNLEVLETRNVIGYRGLEVLASSCKKLQRLRIERGADEQEMEDEEGVVTQRRLISENDDASENFISAWVHMFNSYDADRKGKEESHCTG